METEIGFRVVFLVVLLLAISISTYYRRQARQEGGVIARKEEGVAIFALRMIVALPLLLSLLLYGFYPRWLAWSAVPLPLWLRYLFAAVAILCLPLIWWVLRSIGKNISETVLVKKEHQLVKKGPYRWIRHPLYATAMLLLCSFSIISTSWFLFAYFVVTVLVFRFLVIPEEEKNLVEAFGQAYRDYQKETGALFPRLWPG